VTPTESYEYYKNDYLGMDEVETVTLTPSEAVGGAAVTTAKAKFGEISRGELLRIGAELIAAPYEIVITLFDVTLTGLLPAHGFMVTQAGLEKWNLVSVARCKHRTQWVCTASRGK
jgi:hypothetical protein